jgi:hypothetical protein
MYSMRITIGHFWHQERQAFWEFEAESAILTNVYCDLCCNTVLLFGAIPDDRGTSRRALQKRPYAVDSSTPWFGITSSLKFTVASLHSKNTKSSPEIF